MTARLRLDEALVAAGLAPSRARARDMILRGRVAVDGAPETRPGRRVAPEARIRADDPASGYVSRAALKLAAALDAFGFSPAGLAALDLGASTGGFAQVLLERGAARVFAVDVGHGQLHPAIAGDERVTAIEGLNARDLAGRHLGGVRPQAIVADLSFISLKLALPSALALAAPGAWAALLVKPQFEVGREAVGRGGLVRDPAAGRAAAEGIGRWLEAEQGWRVAGLVPSPIAGGDGAQEYLLGARHG